MIEGTDAESEGDDMSGERGISVDDGSGPRIAAPRGIDISESINSMSGLLSVRRALSSVALKSIGSNAAQAYSSYEKRKLGKTRTKKSDTWYMISATYFSLYFSGATATATRRSCKMRKMLDGRPGEGVINDAVGGTTE